MKLEYKSEGVQKAENEQMNKQLTTHGEKHKAGRGLQMVP